MTSTALLTDHYELTMLDAAVKSGAAHRPSVFEVFARRLPGGHRYGVVAGLERVIDAVAAFRFDDADLAWLADRRIVSEPTLDHLAGYRFGGQIWAYREGELFFPGSPVLTVSGSFAEAVVLETVILSILNHDTAIATAGARMVQAAEGRSLLEFGGRRTHEVAAVAAARAAYLTGFDGTSNLAAGNRYGIPTLGTAAHAFTLLHDDEPSAFRAQVDAMGRDTTLLVDTYDTPQGIRNAIAAAGPDLYAIRIDSGDLGDEAVRARALLDELGATGTRIIASGDLDEYRLCELREAPVDGYGIGTRLVTGSGHPTAGFVYKLVARARSTDSDAPLEPVAKISGAKSTRGGHKRAFRRIEDGRAVRELVVDWSDGPAAAADLRALQVEVVRDGIEVHRPPLVEIRAHHRAAMAELTEDCRTGLAADDPAIPTDIRVTSAPAGSEQA